LYHPSLKSHLFVSVACVARLHTKRLDDFPGLGKLSQPVQIVSYYYHFKETKW